MILRMSAVLLLTLLTASPCLAWNSTGHMVIAVLAHRMLTAPQKAKIHELLKQHPHYAIYLGKDKPTNAPEDEFAFARAAVWPDFVRSGPSDITGYNIPKRHYINRPFVKPGEDSFVDWTEAKKIEEENVRYGLQRCSKRMTDASLQPKQQAVDLAWYLHLAGDVHQPLHSTSLYGKDFPKGDQGGNLVYVQSNGRMFRLHQYWDDAINGSEFGGDWSVVDGLVKEIQHDPACQRDALAKDFDPNAGFQGWIDESAKLAEEVAYKRGKLEYAKKRKPDFSSPPPKEAPELGAEYEKTARSVSFRRGAMAAFRIAEQMNKSFPAQ